MRIYNNQKVYKGLCRYNTMEYNALLVKFTKFFDEDASTLLCDAVSSNHVIVIDSELLEKFDTELFDYFIDNPTECFDIIKDCLDTINVCDENIAFRLSNLPEQYKVPINALRSVHLDKFIGLDGIIKQVSEVRPEVNYTVWECNECGEKQSIIVDGQLIDKPFSCQCGNSKLFSLISKKMIDVQKIVLEEPQDNLDSGKQARKINIFLSGDLVDPSFQRSIIPGNRVKLSGVLLDKPLRIERGKETARREILMDCNYIENTEQDLDDLELTEQDIIEIKQIANNPKIYDNLIKSIAPSIFGYEDVKLAIGLQLFSGVQKVRADGMKSRGDIHILLVGDPGAAKSQMLKYVCDLSPKGRYVVGKSTSGAGLTAAAVKDEFTGSWALEAGALVLANGGLVAIDEMDKMDKHDRSAMHEAMEQQTITINKASIQASLSAKTIILAAANPKFGRFDPFTSIPEQIDLPDTLISRFDLIFPIRDIPDKKKDMDISGHILSLHKNPTKQNPPINQKMIRKYISYARNHCNPKLTDEVIKTIQKFYVKLRNAKSNEENPPVPLTARQLEALVRLSEASARIRLSETVDVSDAKRAIKLLKDCLSKVGVDPETGLPDIDVMTSGFSKKKRNVLVTILNKVSELSDKSDNGMAFMEDILESIESTDLDRIKIESVISSLKSDGELFEPRLGYYRRVNR